jgi:2-hydroxy-3-keto-5-methylthiopentenyl-1-phosphate phosphatase
MDLSGASVFLDFDGTVTTYDTGLHLMERLAPEIWRVIEERYLSGEIGSRRCMLEQFRLLPRDRRLIESVAAQVPLDPGLAPLVAHLRSVGAEVTIVSDGYGLLVGEVGERAGVPVLTNSIDWDRFEIVFPHGDETCACAACGTCKQAPIRRAQRAGARAVLVGDGPSDARAAEVADIVFAKEPLAALCRAAGIAHHRFTDLTDLLRRLSAGHPR